jgi:electron transport complex protein RnfC
MKATSGILVLTEEEVNENEETPCLKCGKCIEVCPLGLMPTKLARYSQLDRLEEAEGLDITVCMECGTCAYTCPANIPLVQWIRLGKKRVIDMQRRQKSA